MSKIIYPEFPGVCAVCTRTYHKNNPIWWDQATKLASHLECHKAQGSGSLFIENGRVRLNASYDPALWEAISKLGLGSSSKSGWTFPKLDADTTSKLIDLCAGYGLLVREEDRLKLGEIMVNGLMNEQESASSTSTQAIDFLNKKPYPFQAIGISRARREKRSIIGDEQGLGKTIQAIGVIHDQLPAVIVCPAVVKSNWERELRECLGDPKTETLTGRTPYTPTGDFIIINYDILFWWVETLKALAPKAIVFDELHYLKSHKAQRSKAALKLASGIPIVLGLTGTAIVRSPIDLVHPLRIIRRLDELGGRQFYEKRYCGAGLDPFGRWDNKGATNLFELNKRLRSTGIYMRRNKREVLTELPPKQRQIVLLELDNRAAYNKAEADVAKWLADLAVENEVFQESIAHLAPLDKIQATKEYHDRVQWRKRQSQQLERFHVLQSMASQGKMSALKTWLSDFLASGEKLIVFAELIATQKALADAFPHAVTAFGEDSMRSRDMAIQEFKEENKQLFILSRKAMGIGINLTTASNVAFAELAWRSVDHDQAEDRVHRHGQEMPVNVYYCIAHDTIEEDKARIIDVSRKIVTATVEGVNVHETDVINALITRLLNRYKEK